MPTTTIDAKEFWISEELFEQFEVIWGVPGLSIEEKIKEMLDACEPEEECVQLYSYLLIWCEDVRPAHIGAVAAGAGRSQRDRIITIATSAGKRRNQKSLASR